MTVSVTKDITKDLIKKIEYMVTSEVIVGIPGDSPGRKPEPGESSAPSNSTIGYTQEFGDPERNIPPRPFLIPGVEDAKSAIVDELARTARRVLESGISADLGLQRVGLLAQNSVKRKITDGPFLPLSERTIAARADRGRVGAKQYLKLKKQGVPLDILQSADLVKPLIDTGQLRQSITFVVRQR